MLGFVMLGFVMLGFVVISFVMICCRLANDHQILSREMMTSLVFAKAHPEIRWPVARY